nr:MAG TPA: hypothetical protein [Caudoviricetes sp.]DAH80613.1 MAG TPA: hypothetical protein [Caudoviricetes sp.]
MRINFIKEKNKPLHADNIRLGDTSDKQSMCKFTQILQLPQNTKGGIARC